jgi:hypothetical protein
MLVFIYRGNQLRFKASRENSNVLSFRVQILNNQLNTVRDNDNFLANLREKTG